MYYDNKLDESTWNFKERKIGLLQKPVVKPYTKEITYE